MSKTGLHTIYRNSDNQRVPSVTTIINDNLGWNKQILINWAAKQALEGQDHTKIKEEAADIGTLAHYLIECHLKKEKPVLTSYSKEHIQLAKNSLTAYKRWEKKHKLTCVFSELSLVHAHLNYGGTIDMIAQSKQDGLWLVDFKTSNGVYPEYIVQVAAYRELFQSNFPNQPIKECHLLRLSKTDSAFEHHALTEDKLDAAYKIFLDLLDLNYLRSKIK